MVSIKIEGPRDKQIYIVEGNAAIREFRSTEIKKSVGKKKKWIYRPDNKKERYEKNI